MKTIKTLLLLIVFIFSLNIVYGSGVSSPYGENLPLVMAPGQTHEFYLELQNMVGEEDMFAMLDVVGGKEFIEILDTKKEYVVPVNTKDTKVNVMVSVPGETKEGSYNLEINVQMSPMKEEGNGMVEFKQGMIVKIPLEVKKEAKPPVSAPLSKTSEGSGSVAESNKGLSNLLVALIALVVIVLLIFFLKRKRK